jgi:ABC-type sugar transport system substrate-binding protein
VWTERQSSAEVAFRIRSANTGLTWIRRGRIVARTLRQAPRVTTWRTEHVPDCDHIWELDCSTMSWVTEPLSRRQILRAGAGALASFGALGALAACGDDADSSPAGAGGRPGEGKTIALSLNGFNTYDQNTAEGVLKALAGTAYKLIGAEAAFDASKESANIKQLIARQPDGLIILAASADGASRAAVEAKEQGIPVISQLWFPTDAEADEVYLAAFAIESETHGRQSVEFIAKTKGITEGKILEVTGLDAQPLSEGYKQGFKQALKAYPGLEVASSQQGFYTADGALKAFKPMLSAHPDAKVVIDYAAEMGVAIAQELERQGRKDILHLTSDGNDRMVPWLKKAGGVYLAGDRWFSAADQGVASVNVLRAKLERDEDPGADTVGLEGWEMIPGTKDPVVYNTRQVVATAENIDDLPPFGYAEYTKAIPFGA